MLSDGWGTVYRCAVYPVRAPVTVTRAVFAFSRLDGIWPEPVFLGAAGDWALRLALHPRREEAIALGAIHLLIHAPDPDDPLAPAEAVERLVAFHRPRLNAAPPPQPPAIRERALHAPQAAAELPLRRPR